MSLSARANSDELGVVQSDRQLPPRPRTRSWFAWWAALCLAIVAYNTCQQVAIQRRILGGSRALEARVAEARAVTGATNQQLGRVAEIERATVRLDETLERLGAANQAIRQRLSALEAVVGENLQTAVSLDSQVLRSQQTVGEIIEESHRLHAALLRSREAGKEVSAHLRALVGLQEGINADLAAMNRKTGLLERGSGS